MAECPVCYKMFYPSGNHSGRQKLAQHVSNLGHYFHRNYPANSGSVDCRVCGKTFYTGYYHRAGEKLNMHRSSTGH